MERRPVFGCFHQPGMGTTDLQTRITNPCNVVTVNLGLQECVALDDGFHSIHMVSSLRLIKQWL
jgi:hypothetical protein